MKVPLNQEIQQMANNHFFDIDSKGFMEHAENVVKNKIIFSH